MLLLRLLPRPRNPGRGLFSLFLFHPFLPFSFFPFSLDDSLPIADRCKFLPPQVGGLWYTYCPKMTDGFFLFSTSFSFFFFLIFSPFLSCISLDPVFHDYFTFSCSWYLIFVGTWA